MDTSNKPSHRIFQVEDRGEGKKTYWREVGVAFTNKDGSQNLSFAVTPMFGKHTIQMRPYDENDKTEGADSDAAGERKGRNKK